jgi:ADP-ribose pyrophosphatase YjhB (NUDIX family)
MTDITVDLDGYRFNLRVGAVVTRGDEVLLCRIRDEDWWFLPGGRIKTNESSLTALKRELSEEIGHDFHVIRPLVCSENFFELDGQAFHEICIFYEVEWTGGPVLYRQDGEEGVEIFHWTSRHDVLDVDLKPSFIKEHIARPRSGLELVIHHEREPGQGPNARATHKVSSRSTQ